MPLLQGYRRRYMSAISALEFTTSNRLYCNCPVQQKFVCSQFEAMLSFQLSFILIQLHKLQILLVYLSQKIGFYICRSLFSPYQLMFYLAFSMKTICDKRHIYFNVVTTVHFTSMKEYAVKNYAYLCAKLNLICIAKVYTCGFNVTRSVGFNQLA